VPFRCPIISRPQREVAIIRRATRNHRARLDKYNDDDLSAAVARSCNFPRRLRFRIDAASKIFCLNEHYRMDGNRFQILRASEHPSVVASPNEYRLWISKARLAIVKKKRETAQTRVISIVQLYRVLARETPIAYLFLWIVPSNRY